MTKLPKIERRSGALPVRRFRAWLCTWLQDRRRGRALPDDVPLPLTVPGLKLWVRTESLAALANDAPVAAWADESGNNQHLVQATAANRPLYKSDVGGLPAVYFDGVNDVLATAGVVLNPAQHTIFLVAQPVGLASNDAIGTGSTGNGDLLLMIAYANRMRGHLWRGASANTTDDSAYLVANVNALFEQEATATQLILRLNGVQGAAQTLLGTPASVSKPIYLGSRNSAWFFQGYVRALLVYEGNPNPTDKAALRDYLIATYGVTTPYPTPPAPAAPIELSAYSNVDYVSLEWLTMDEGIVTYVSVEKKVAGEPDGNYLEIAQVPPGDNYHEDWELYDAGYTYRLRSFGPGGFSAYCDAVTVTL